MNAEETHPRTHAHAQGNLTHLDMHGNKITSLPDGVFDALPLLEELWLEKNGLTALPEGVFGMSAKLKILVSDMTACCKPVEHVSTQGTGGCSGDECGEWH